MKERCAARVGTRSDRSENRGYARSDISTENYEQSARDLHRARARKRNYYRGSRRRALNKRGKRHSYKYQKKREIDGSERARHNFFYRRIARKRAAHRVESDKHKSESAKNSADFFNVVAFEKRHHHAHKRERGSVKIYVQRAKRNQKAGCRRSDVRAHNYGSSLRERHNARVYEAYRHNRGCSRTVYYYGNERAHAYACETVAGQMVEKSFHSLARAAFQTFAHQVHSYHEHAYSRK